MTEKSLRDDLKMLEKTEQLLHAYTPDQLRDALKLAISIAREAAMSRDAAVKVTEGAHELCINELWNAQGEIEKLRAAIEKIKEIPVLTKADEDTPDDKEDAYILGYGDALVDVQQILREGE